MSANKKAVDLDIKVKLSTLWIVVMFTMAFADILSFITPGVLKEMMSGYAGAMRITRGILLLFAVLLEIPIAMIFLSRVLNYKANRLANIAAAVITILFVVGGGSPHPHYIFFAAVEVACMALIVFFAVKWSDPEGEVKNIEG